MESTIRQTNSVKHELDVALTKDELAPYLNTAYKEAQKHASIKGFRKGKVPLDMVRKLYGPSLEREAFEEAVQQEFSKYVQEKDIRPIGQPSITKLDRTDDGGIAFTVTYEVFPQIELGEYKGLQARKIYHTVTDEELENELRRLRENYAEQSEEPAEQVTDEHHTVKVDLKKVVDGEPTDEGAMTDMPVFLARHDMNQELKAAILNTKVGDTFRIDLPTGENNAMTNYEVTIREIRRMALPEIDDALAQKLLGREDAVADDLINTVRTEVASEYERRYQGYFRDELINALLEQHQFDVPDALVVEVLRSFMEDMKKGPKKELPKDFNPEKFVQEMRPTAERTARWAVLRDMIIDREGLQADDVDYEGLADLESQSTGIDYETLVNYFKKSDKIRDRILAEKAIQFLEDYAIVQEVEDHEVATQARLEAEAIEREGDGGSGREGEPEGVEEKESEG